MGTVGFAATEGSPRFQEAPMPLHAGNLHVADQLYAFGAFRTASQPSQVAEMRDRNWRYQFDKPRLGGYTMPFVIHHPMQYANASKKGTGHCAELLQEILGIERC